MNKPVQSVTGKSAVQYILAGTVDGAAVLKRTGKSMS